MKAISLSLAMAAIVYVVTQCNYVRPEGKWLEVKIGGQVLARHWTTNREVTRIHPAQTNFMLYNYDTDTISFNHAEQRTTNYLW